MDVLTIGTDRYHTLRGTDFWYEILFGTVRDSLSSLFREGLLTKIQIKILIPFILLKNADFQMQKEMDITNHSEDNLLVLD